MSLNPKKKKNVMTFQSSFWYRLEVQSQKFPKFLDITRCKPLWSPFINALFRPIIARDELQSQISVNLPRRSTHSGFRRLMNEAFSASVMRACIRDIAG